MSFLHNEHIWSFILSFLIQVVVYHAILYTLSSSIPRCFCHEQEASPPDWPEHCGSVFLLCCPQGSKHYFTGGKEMCGGIFYFIFIYQRWMRLAIIRLNNILSEKKMMHVLFIKESWLSPYNCGTCPNVDTENIWRNTRALTVWRPIDKCYSLCAS